ncbi:serine/threonine-protein kinase [Kytococcus sp. Marseille-QA3725]
MGDVFAGRYELVDPLGEGGTGVVWRVWDHRQHRYSAAKVLRQVDAASMVRFVREQGVRVQHPHLLVPWGWAGDDERVMLVMPVVDGGSASTLLREHGALPPVWGATLLDQLLQGLGRLHDEGMVHRDVKPANLLLDATGRGMPRARLADFGLAMAMGDPRLTTGPFVQGTRGYMAPESLTHGWDPSPAADLFGAGMTAREMLTGRRPEGADQAAVAGELIRARVPSELAAVVLDLVEHDPDDRPASAQEALEALRATGWVAAAEEQLEEGVSVHDHLPELPGGWGPEGPTVGDDRLPAGPPRHDRSLPPSGAATTTMYDVPVRSDQADLQGPAAPTQAAPAARPSGDSGARRAVSRQDGSSGGTRLITGPSERTTGPDRAAAPLVPTWLAWGLVVSGILVLLLVLVLAVL